MTCKVIDLPGGGQAIVCSRGKRDLKCWKCGRPAGKLCDWPTGGRKTCDHAMCDQHSHPKGISLDYCDEHAKKKGE